MAEILRSPVEGTVVYPIAYEVLAPSQVVGLGISSINSRKAPNHGAYRNSDQEKNSHPKTNMDSQNNHIWKEIHLKKHHFWYAFFSAGKNSFRQSLFLQ